MADVMRDIREKDELLFSEVKKLKLGYSDDFNKVYELSKNYIYKIIWDIVKNRDAVEDIMQETYLQIYNRIETLKEVSSFYAWAGRIATNFSLAYLRKENKYVLSSADEDGDAEGFTYEKATDDHEVMIPETVLVNREQQNIIRGILDGLSTEQKICVQYYYFEEMSVKEIAEQMDTSEGTVKSRLNYARKAIKSAVQKFEKEQGTKLYSLGAFPILMLLYRGAIQDYFAGMAAAGAATGAAAVAGKAVAADGAAKNIGAAYGVAKGAAGETATSVSYAGSATAAGSAASVTASTFTTAATTSTAAVTAGATGISAGVKALAVIIAVGAIGGGGYAVHQYNENQRILVAQEAARLEQVRQQQLISQAQGKYSYIFESYEDLSGSGNLATAEHLMNLTSNEARIYGILNESSECLETFRSECKKFMTNDQYQVMNTYFFAQYDQSIEQQIISAELIIDMNRYYGNTAAMKNYISKTEAMVSGASGLLGSAQTIFLDPMAKAIMNQYSAAELEYWITNEETPMTPMDMIAVYIQNNPSDQFASLVDKLNSHYYTSEAYMQTMIDWANCLADPDFARIYEDYVNNHLKDNALLRTRLSELGY